MGVPNCNYRGNTFRLRPLTGDGDTAALQSEGDPFLHRQIGVGVVERTHDNELAPSKERERTHKKKHIQVNERRRSL